MATELKIGIGADVSGLNEGLQSAEQSIAKFGKNIALVGAGLTATITVPLFKVGQAALETFGQLEGVKIAFERLNDATLLNDLRKATSGTTSDLILMKNAVQADNFGLPVKELGSLLEFASRRAKDTGQNVDYLVDSIVTGIGRKSPLILDNLGISAAALKAELNGVAIETASVGQVTEAVGAIARKELTKMGKDTLTYNEMLLKVQATTANLMTELGAIIAPIMKPFVEFLGNIVEGFQNLDPEIKKVIVIIGGLAVALGPVLVVVGGILATLPSISAGFGVLTTALGVTTGGFLAMLGPIALVVAGIAGIIAVVVANWDKIKPYIVGTINYFVDLYNESVVVRIGIEALALYFKNTFAVIKGVLSGAYEIFKSFAKTTVETFAGVGEVIKASLSFDIGGITSGIARVNKSFVDFGSDLKSDFKNIAVGIGNDLTKNLNTAISNVKNNKLAKVTDINLGFGGSKTKEQTTAEVAKSIIDGVKSGVEIAKTEIESTPLVPISVPIEITSELDNLKKTLQSDLDFKTLIDEQISKPLATIPLSISDTALKMQEANLQFQDAASKILENGIEDAIASSATGIGDALATGGSVIKALGTTVLSTIGDIAIQLGKAAIGIGVGMIAIKKAFTNPLTAIAAGVALVAIGGFIKGKVANMTSGVGSGSVPSTGSVESGAGGNYNSPSANYNTGNSQSTQNYVFEISGYSLVGVIDKQLQQNKKLGGITTLGG